MAGAVYAFRDILNKTAVSNQGVHAGGWNEQEARRPRPARLPLGAELQLVFYPSASQLKMSLCLTGTRMLVRGGRPVDQAERLVEESACQVYLRDGLFGLLGQDWKPTLTRFSA